MHQVHFKRLIVKDLIFMEKLFSTKARKKRKISCFPKFVFS